MGLPTSHRRDRSSVVSSQAAQGAGITLPSSSARKRKPAANPAADLVAALPRPAPAGAVPASQHQQQLLTASAAVEPVRKKARRAAARLPPLPGTAASLLLLSFWACQSSTEPKTQQQNVVCGMPEHHQVQATAQGFYNMSCLH